MFIQPTGENTKVSILTGMSLPKVPQVIKHEKGGDRNRSRPSHYLGNRNMLWPMCCPVSYPTSQKGSVLDGFKTLASGKFLLQLKQGQWNYFNF